MTCGEILSDIFLSAMSAKSKGRNSISGRSRALERMVKGFANHRRLSMIDLLEKTPDLSLSEIAMTLRIDIKTASEHLRRLAHAGLVGKRACGREVRHTLTGRGKKALEFLSALF